MNFAGPTDELGRVAQAVAGVLGDEAARVGDLEEKTEALAMQHDTFSRNTRNQLKQVFDALRELMTPPDPPKRPIVEVQRLPKAIRWNAGLGWLPRVTAPVRRRNCWTNKPQNAATVSNVHW